MEIEQIALKLQETSDKACRNEGRIKKLENESSVLHQLATSVAVMAEQMQNMNGNVSKLSQKVEKLESKPGKRWDSLISNIVFAVAGAIVAFVFAKIGL